VGTAWRFDGDATSRVQGGVGRTVTLHAIGGCRRCIGVRQ
jgi:hypothetical protein